MQIRNDGGSAFPRTGAGNAGVAYDVPAQDGMTLRDYFAAKAMQGMLAHPECDYSPITEKSQAQIVADAYGIADAMLAEREGHP